MMCTMVETEALAVGQDVCAKGGGGRGVGVASGDKDRYHDVRAAGAHRDRKLLSVPHARAN